MQYSSDQWMCHIIEPCLRHVDIYTPQMSIFLCSLAMSEPAGMSPDRFGPFAMTHEQHWRLWDQHLALDPPLASKIRGMASQHRFLVDPDMELNMNWGYAVAIAAVWLHKNGVSADPVPSAEELIESWFSTNLNLNQLAYRQFAQCYRKIRKEIAEKAA